MLPVFKAQIDDDTIAAAAAVLGSGWLGMGGVVESFEHELARFLELPDERKVVAVNTGTSALHLALLAAGVRAGDEVITPAFNNLGDFQAIAACGADPVFCDVHDDDLTLDLDSCWSLLGPRVKAILPLHYMGFACDAAVYDFARANGLRVVEDACHAIGSRWPVNAGMARRRIGAVGDLQCFSFDPIKTITCIDGGAVTCGEDEVETIRRARLLGVAQPPERRYVEVGRSLAAADGRYDVHGPGFRYHLANVHAAIGLSQLEHLPAWIDARRSYATYYNDAFAELPLRTPPGSLDGVSLFGYAVRVPGARREQLRAHLRERGVDSGVHWRPGHWLSWFSGCRGADRLPVSDWVGDEITTLPLWSLMSEDDCDQVVDAVGSFYA